MYHLQVRRVPVAPIVPHWAQQPEQRLKLLPALSLSQQLHAQLLGSLQGVQLACLHLQPLPEGLHQRCCAHLEQQQTLVSLCLPRCFAGLPPLPEEGLCTCRQEPQALKRRPVWVKPPKELAALGLLATLWHGGPATKGPAEQVCAALRASPSTAHLAHTV